MAKLSRTVLKEIVKECIVEIFEESFFSSGPTINESRDYKEVDNISNSKRGKRSARNHIKYANEHSRKDIVDNMVYENKNVARNEAFERKVDNVARNMTDDPVMEGIFKDTAMTTLQSQSENSRGRPAGLISGGDKASMKAYQSDPQDLFSESAGKWAALAFSDPVNK